MSLNSIILISPFANVMRIALRRNDVRSTQSVSRVNVFRILGRFGVSTTFESPVALRVPTKFNVELAPQFNCRIVAEILLNRPLRSPDVNHLAQVSRRPGGCHRVSIDDDSAALRRRVPQRHARRTLHGQRAVSDQWHRKQR